MSNKTRMTRLEKLSHRVNHTPDSEAEFKILLLTVIKDLEGRIAQLERDNCPHLRAGYD